MTDEQFAIAQCPVFAKRRIWTMSKDNTQYARHLAVQYNYFLQEAEEIKKN
jgi:hypothetical protein